MTVLYVIQDQGGHGREGASSVHPVQTTSLHYIAQALSVSREVFYITHEGAEGLREELDASFQDSYSSSEGFYLIDEG